MNCWVKCIITFGDVRCGTIKLYCTVQIGVSNIKPNLTDTNRVDNMIEILLSIAECDSTVFMSLYHFFFPFHLAHVLFLNLWQLWLYTCKILQWVVAMVTHESNCTSLFMNEWIKTCAQITTFSKEILGLLLGNPGEYVFTAVCSLNLKNWTSLSIAGFFFFFLNLYQRFCVLVWNCAVECDNVDSLAFCVYLCFSSL